MRRLHRMSINRRQALQALGLGSLVGIPAIPLLNASGAEGGGPKRLLLFYTPDGAPAYGQNPVDWKPVGTETDFTFQQIHEPLAPMRHKIVVPWGMTQSHAGPEAHASGITGLWTGTELPDGGWATGPSIDQLVARASGPNCPYSTAPDDPIQETLYRSLELGVGCGGSNNATRMIFSGSDSPLQPEDDPSDAFERLLAGIDTSGDPEPDPAEVQALAEKNAMLGVLKSDVERVRQRAGSEDYYKLDAHLEHLNSLERRINNPIEVVNGCTVGVPPIDGDYPQDVRNMLDVAVSALSCDLTRVMSLQLSVPFGGVIHEWVGAAEKHHFMAHNGGDNRPILTAINQWYADQFLYLLEQMDAIPEGEGTMLDNTLIAWGRETGDTTHRSGRAVFLLAGGGCGALPMGRWLDYDGQPHIKLLVSIGQMMGLDMESIGNLEPNSGGLSGLV